MLLFMESFDHYATSDLLEKWTASTIGTGGSLAVTAGIGRRSSSGLRVTSAANQPCGLSLTPPTIAGATVIAGVAINVAALPASGQVAIVQIGESGTAQVTITLRSDGTLGARRGTAAGTLLGTSSATIQAGLYNYLEILVTIHATAGAVTLRLNSAPVLTLSNVNTQATAAAAWTSFALGVSDGTGPALTADYDDLYLLDGSGAAPWNTFLGDCRVDVRIPTSPGANTQWTSSGGPNWANVDEIPPNDDTDFNAAASVPLTDTFVVQDAPVPGATIYGVQHNLNAKKMDAGPCSLAAVVRQAGTDFASAGAPLTTAYTFARVVQQTNPATGAQWTEAQFNVAEFGYRRTA